VKDFTLEKETHKHLGTFYLFAQEVEPLDLQGRQCTVEENPTDPNVAGEEDAAGLLEVPEADLAFEARKRLLRSADGTAGGLPEHIRPRSYREEIEDVRFAPDSSLEGASLERTRL
jgi:hypothetical protein